MISSSQLHNSSSEKDLSTYVAIPLDLLKNSEDHCNLKVIENLVIKQLEDGSICLVEDEGKQNAYLEQNQEQYPVSFTTTTTITTTTTTPIVNTGCLQKTVPRNRTVLLQPPHKNPSPNKGPIEIKAPKKLLPKPLDKKFKCIKCDNVFDALQLYRDHIKWHKCQKKFKCPKCFAGYNIENNLKIHMVLMHLEENNTQCPICDVNLTFQRAASLKSHLILHQVEEFYTCDECNGEFDREDEFIKHMESHATIKRYEEKPLTCSYCKVEFRDTKELKAHVSDHVKLKRTFLKPKRPRKPGSKKDTKHVCSVCNKSFIKNSLLERHERIHSGERPYKCQYCDRSFTQKGTLQIHISRHTGVKPFSCTLCPARFNQKGNLRVHIQKTHTFPYNEGQKMYKCWQCSCIFKKIATLNGHVTKTHLNKKDTSAAQGDDLIDKVILQLKELEKQTSSNPTEEDNMDKNKENQPKEGVIVENNLRENPDFIHLSESANDGTMKKYFVRQKKIGDVRWYFCNYCSKQFKKPSDLIRHIRVHTREKPFKCKQCKTAFSLKSTLISHMRTHRAKLDYRCKICNSTFVSLRVLNAHIRKHDLDSLPKWQCMTCGFLFNDIEKGCKHRDKEGREKPHIIQPFMHNILKQPLFQTTYGSLPFKPPKTKFPNTGTESPTIRPFHCTICDARFTRRINLKRHIQYHNGERKFECHICPKTFITSYRLKDHLNYHNNVKNHVCTVCGKRYVTASLLKRHLIVHNTHKPYLCPYCMKTFKTLLLCRTHINQVHKKDVVPKFVPDSNESISDNPTENDNLQTSAEFMPNPNSNVTINTLQEVQGNVSEDLPVDSENLVIQQFLPVTSNHIQILNANVDGQDQNNYQTIYVNIDELPFLNSSNLSLNSSQLKLQNEDALLNPMNDLQDNNIIFNIDPLKPGMDVPPVEIFSNSQRENIRVSATNTNTLPSIAEISTKTIKLNSFSEKNLTEKTVNLNHLLNNSSIYSNVDYVEGLSLPMTIAEGTNVFSTTTPTTLFQPITSTDLSQTEEIYESTNIMCITCSKIFTNLESFQNHPCDVLTEEEAAKGTAANLEKPEQVSNNNDEISEQENTHETEEQSKEIFECHICKKVLASKISHSKHVISHESKPSYECGVCQKVIQGRSLYVKHLASHTGSSLLRSCKYCFKDFKKPSDLKRHLRTHTGEKPFGCHLCDKKFSLKSTLESHIKTHDPAPKQFCCAVCNSFFSSKSSLKVHSTIHTGQRNQSCSFCNQKFRTAGNRKSHEVLMHLSKSKKSGTSKHTRITNVLESVASEIENNDRKDNTLAIESKETISAQDDSPNENLEVLPEQILNLSDNLLPSLPDDQISIDSVMLLQQLQMSGMILTNDNNEPVSSLMLDDVTLLNVDGSKDNVVISLPSSQSNITISEESLVKPEKPKTLECDICHKMYSSKQILRKHRKKIHGVNKKYPCIKCDKGFDTQDELNKHIKLHAGYRPFSCLYCANSFTEEHNLKTHVKRIHEHSNVTKETASALLNMRFDFPTTNLEEPLFNNLFMLKKSG